VNITIEGVFTRTRYVENITVDEVFTRTRYVENITIEEVAVLSVIKSI